MEVIKLLFTNSNWLHSKLWVKGEISCVSIIVPFAFTCPIFTWASSSACIPRQLLGLSWQQHIADLVIHAGQMCSKSTQFISQIRACQIMGKILAPSEIGGKLSVDLGVLLTALQYFWFSMGSVPRKYFFPSCSCSISSQAHLGSRVIQSGDLGYCRETHRGVVWVLQAHSEKDFYMKCFC